MPRTTKGRLEKRGKIWLAIWTHNGKRNAKSTGTGDRAKAEKFLKEQVGDFATENVLEQARRITARALSDLPSPPLSSAWTLFDKATNRTRCAPRGEAELKQRIERFVAWCAAKHPPIATFRQVTDEIAAEYWRDLCDNFAPYTANAHKQTLNRLWTLALAHDPVAVAGSPWTPAKIKSLPKTGHSRRELTVDELTRVLSSLEGETRTLFAIGIYTGLRLGDTIALDWGNVDLVQGFISAKPGKTARHGTRVRVPVAPALRDLLAATPADKRTGPVLPELLAKYRKNRKGVSTMIQGIFENAGIQTNVQGAKRMAVEVGFHSLRHTFVSLSANAGVPLAVVQAIVGHTNAAMTSHYFHVADSALKKAVEPFPDVLNPNAEPAKAEPVAIQRFRDLLATMSADEKAQALAILKEAVG